MDVKIANILQSDIDLICNTDVDYITPLVAKNIWRNHLRMFDGIMVSQCKIEKIKSEIFDKIGSDKIEVYNNNLNKLQIKIKGVR